MGLFDSIMSSSGVGMASLAASIEKAPNKMGCYIMKLKGRIVYVGKAEDGLRKRFVQYYHATAGGYGSADMIHENRDEIRVQWKVLSTREECVSVERLWIKKYNPPWNERSGWNR